MTSSSSKAKDLAAIITSERGKILTDALGEVKRGMEVAELATCVPELLKGDFTGHVGRGIDSYLCASCWAFALASRHSTSRPWRRRGCCRQRSFTEIALSSSHRAQPAGVFM